MPTARGPRSALGESAVIFAQNPLFFRCFSGAGEAGVPVIRILGRKPAAAGGNPENPDDWDPCVFSLVVLQNGSFEQLATNCAILPNVYLSCFLGSKCFLLFLVGQHDIEITNLS